MVTQRTQQRAGGQSRDDTLRRVSVLFPIKPARPKTDTSEPISLSPFIVPLLELHETRVPTAFGKYGQRDSWGRCYEMKKTHQAVIAVAIVLVLGALAVDSVAAINAEPAQEVAGRNLVPSPLNLSVDVASVDAVLITDIVDGENLRARIPPTYDEAEAQVCPVRSRFILWTHDGVHVMWGQYGNGYFIGRDNAGKRCWGIYGRGVFAGFYDHAFFWGRYQAGRWKAEGLFGLNQAHGQYVVFPSIKPVPTTVQSQP